MTTCQVLSFLNNNLNRDMTRVIFGRVKELEQIDTTKRNHNALMKELTGKKNYADIYYDECLQPYIKEVYDEEASNYWRGTHQPDFFIPTENDDINPLYEMFIELHGLNEPVLILDL